MILDREKENKNHGKETQLSQFPDDLCGKLKKLDLRGSQTSENTNNFSKMKDKMKLKHNSEDNAISNIGEMISNIKIFDDKDKSVPSGKQKENVPSQNVLNIVCDSKIEDQNVFKHDSNVNSEKEQELSSDKEKNIVEVGSEEKDSCKYKSDSSSLINTEKKEIEQKDTESKNEKPDVPKKTDDDLCSRGPVPQKSYQQQFLPYSTCNRSHQSGGRVRVTESLGQLPVNNFQQTIWNHDIPNFNFLPSGQEECTPPVQTSYLPIAQEQANNSNVSEEQNCDVLFNELCQNALIQLCCDSILDGNSSNNLPSSSATCKEQISQNGIDEGLPSSPSVSERSSSGSPHGSPHDSFLRPPARSVGSDSGLESPPYIMEDYITEHPLQTFMNRTDTVVNGPERTESWVLDHAQEVHTQKPFRAILPKPEIPSAKTKFQDILNQDWKFRAWAKVQTLSDAYFKSKDADGDTQLMIVVSNTFDGQLELIYAMVERMRQIPHSLNILNEAGHSALYLACKLLPEQPLVAAYIAEALLEQDIDVNTTYESDLTLPQILKNEGDSHIAVLKELLALKDSHGKLVFQPYHNDVNGNI